MYVSVFYDFLFKENSTKHFDLEVLEDIAKDLTTVAYFIENNYENEEN